MSLFVASNCVLFFDMFYSINQLSDLPASCSSLTSLREINISNNRLVILYFSRIYANP